MGMGNVDLIHAAAGQMKCEYTINAPFSQSRPVLLIVFGGRRPRSFTAVTFEIVVAV